MDPWNAAPVSDPWTQTAQIRQPAHHEQGPMPDWATPMAAPISAQPVSAAPSQQVMNTLEVLRSMQAGNEIARTDDIQPAF
jgi:hypothetical protein